MIVLTYFQLFCSPATTISNTSNVICFSSNVHSYYSDLSDGILVVEKPNLTSLNHFPVGERGSGVNLSGSCFAP